MWTPTTRAQHSRKDLRYQTDLTDAEWAVIAPHLPRERDTGRPQSWPMRSIILLRGSHSPEVCAPFRCRISP